MPKRKRSEGGRRGEEEGGGGTDLPPLLGEATYSYGLCDCRRPDGSQCGRCVYRVARRCNEHLDLYDGLEVKTSKLGEFNGLFATCRFVGRTRGRGCRIGDEYTGESVPGGSNWRQAGGYLMFKSATWEGELPSRFVEDERYNLDDVETWYDARDSQSCVVRYANTVTRSDKNRAWKRQKCRNNARFFGQKLRAIHHINAGDEILANYGNRAYDVLPGKPAAQVARLIRRAKKAALDLDLPPPTVAALDLRTALPNRLHQVQQATLDRATQENDLLQGVNGEPSPELVQLLTLQTALEKRDAVRKELTKQVEEHLPQLSLGYAPTPEEEEGEGESQNWAVWVEDERQTEANLYQLLEQGHCATACAWRLLQLRSKFRRQILNDQVNSMLLVDALWQAQEKEGGPAQHAYFVRIKGSRFVKIGFSGHVVERFCRAKAACPFPLELECCLLDRDLPHCEKLLRAKLQKYLVRGEWYDLQQRLDFTGVFAGVAA